MSTATNMMLFTAINASRPGAYTGYGSSKMSAAGGMGGDPEDDLVLALVGVLFVIFVMLTAVVLVNNHNRKEHSEFLQRQGCVFYGKAPTGVRIHTGKGNYRDQIQTVYLCKDGPITEVD